MSDTLVDRSKRKGKGAVVATSVDEESADADGGGRKTKSKTTKKKKKLQKQANGAGSVGSIKPEVSSEDANGPNAKFFELLQADGLVQVEGDDGDGAADVPQDEDEAEMKRMEKLLNMKGGKLSKEFEDDGLGGLLDFTTLDKDDEEGMQWVNADSGSGSDEDNEDDEDDDDADDADDSKQQVDYSSAKIRAAAAAIAANYSDGDDDDDDDDGGGGVEYSDDEELESVGQS